MKKYYYLVCLFTISRFSSEELISFALLQNYFTLRDISSNFCHQLVSENQGFLL